MLGLKNYYYTSFSLKHVELTSGCKGLISLLERQTSVLKVDLLVRTSLEAYADNS